MTNSKADELQELIVGLARKYHSERERDRCFVPGETLVMPSGAALDEDDRAARVEAALNMRIASGPIAIALERGLGRVLQRRKVHLTNSGSSANPMALTALTQRELGDGRLRPGERAKIGGRHQTVRQISKRSF